MESKIVQKFGNSSHIILPKDYIGKRIRFVAEPKTFEDIKSEILEILKPYLKMPWEFIYTVLMPEMSKQLTQI